MKKCFKVFIILFIIILFFQIVACTTGYDVHSIEKLQQQVPFTIVTPTYFPKGIIPYPGIISGPDKGGITEDSVMISFTYLEPGSTNQILITEENVEANWMPSSVDSSYINISGVKVLEENADPQNVYKSLNGYQYGWNKNGINFSMVVYGFSNIECRKVIESMIK